MGVPDVGIRNTISSLLVTSLHDCINEALACEGRDRFNSMCYMPVMKTLFAFNVFVYRIYCFTQSYWRARFYVRFIILKLDRLPILKWN